MGQRTHALLIAIMGILLLIVLIQNAEPTSTRILFFTFTMPRALLLFATALVGFIIGALATYRRLRP